MIKLLTRKQIIDIWLEQPDEMLNTVCCPQCRNLLHEFSDRYFCENENCTQGYILKSEIIL